MDCVKRVRYFSPIYAINKKYPKTVLIRRVLSSSDFLSFRPSFLSCVVLVVHFPTTPPHAIKQRHHALTKFRFLLPLFLFRRSALIPLVSL